MDHDHPSIFHKLVTPVRPGMMGYLPVSFSKVPKKTRFKLYLPVRSSESRSTVWAGPVLCHWQ